MRPSVGREYRGSVQMRGLDREGTKDLGRGTRALAESLGQVLELEASQHEEGPPPATTGRRGKARSCGDHEQKPAHRCSGPASSRQRDEA